MAHQQIFEGGANRIEAHHLRLEASEFRDQIMSVIGGHPHPGGAAGDVVGFERGLEIRRYRTDKGGLIAGRFGGHQLQNRADRPHGAVVPDVLEDALARWFELLTARNELTMSVEALARTGRVELETHSETHARISLPDLQERMAEYNRLARRYHRFWPRCELRPAKVPGMPYRMLEHALSRLSRWAEAAEPLVQHLETLQAEHSELRLLQDGSGRCWGSNAYGQLGTGTVGGNSTIPVSVAAAFSTLRWSRFMVTS